MIAVVVKDHVAKQLHSEQVIEVHWAWRAHDTFLNSEVAINAPRHLTLKMPESGTRGVKMPERRPMKPHCISNSS